MKLVKHLMILIVSLSICACNKTTSSSFNSHIDNSSEASIDRYPLITDEIKEIAESYTYDFYPESIVIKEKEEYDFNNSELKNISFTDNRNEHHLIYVFDNQYFIGYNGVYSRCYSKIYLWDDGLYCGELNKKTIKGYWYNCSLNSLNEEKDCLNMVSNISRYEKVECLPVDDGYYDYKAYLDMYYGNSPEYIRIEMSGYLYYPEVAIIIDDNGTDKYRIGHYFYADEITDDYIKTTWSVLRVAKNLTYTPIVPDYDIHWDVPEGLVDDKNRLAKTGEHLITAHWKDFSASKVLKVIL